MGQWLERDVNSMVDSAMCLTAKENYCVVRESWWLRKGEEQWRGEIFWVLEGKTQERVGFRLKLAVHTYDERKVCMGVDAGHLATKWWRQIGCLDCFYFLSLIRNKSLSDIAEK